MTIYLKKDQRGPHGPRKTKEVSFLFKAYEG